MNYYSYSSLVGTSIRAGGASLALVLAHAAALAACAGGAEAVDGGGRPRDGDAAPSGPAGERCGDGTDDDGDGIADEDCPPSLFAGLYAPLLAGDPALAALERAAGRRASVVQTYRSVGRLGRERMVEDLAAIWAAGAVPHLNLEPSGYTPSQFADASTDPAIDADLRAAAALLAGGLADAPAGRLLLTFAAEMNGDWTDWGCLPAATYVALYRKAHDLVTAALAARDIDPRRVRWIYGPNNTSSAGCDSAAGYYPGHSYVDHVGMSSYRSSAATVAAAVVAPAAGLLSGLSYPEAWQEDRFVVLQTGARAAGDRADWLQDLYASLATDSRFAGVVYFDASDWAIEPGTGDFEVWAGAVAALPPADAALAGVFEPYFWDVRMGRAEFREIQALRAAAVTYGCGSAPPRFCPDEPLRRRDAAVLLQRTFHLPEVGGAPRFVDVPAGDPAFGAIQAVAAAGALAGCDLDRFCPEDSTGAAEWIGAMTALGGSPPDELDDESLLTRAPAARILARGAALDEAPPP